MRSILLTISICLVISGSADTSYSWADGQGAQRQLYVVSTAHLDTQWRWTIQNTINEYVPSTFRDNFKLLDQFPGYVFSFEGAFRYMLLKEYYPQDYERLKRYVADGRWRVTGSWVDAVDVNIPSFESLVRHALYGNGYFKREFGKTSRDVFLPDCFGFGYALPSIAHHCGLQSFSTQKLSWGSSVGVPFDIGIWTGVDGSSLIAALNPESYTSQIREDLSRDTLWLQKIDGQGAKSGLFAGFKYFGTGDIGGAPDSASVDWLERSQKSDGPITVKSVGADDLITLALQADTNLLPHYSGELVMTRHGVGCYTSQAAMKRWNRRNELLADATERASVIAMQMGGYQYPREVLRDTWVRFLWHQFHDDLTGTSIPQAYEFSWNDEILCQNRFAAVLENAVEATVPGLDTRTKGIPLVIFNPLAIDREDIVEASVLFDGSPPANIEVFGPDGQAVPAQVVSSNGSEVTILFLAKVPSVGYAVYDVRPTSTPPKTTSTLPASTTGMENERYRLTIDKDGNVASIYDKANQRELLSAPIQYQLLFNKPRQWPAWEIQYEDIGQPPVAVLGNPISVRVVENGPVRVAVEVVRKTGDSESKTTIRLGTGSAGDRIEFDNDINWYEKERLLKVAFPVTTPNDSVTYDLGLGTIRRGINHPELYEVPGHQWAHVMSETGDYGVAILNDCKYGWDHPDKATLRLTLIHTPGVFDSWMWVGDQKSQDMGHHRFTFAVTGQAGDWRNDVAWQAARMNQPIMSFQTNQHNGPMGKSYSFLAVTENANAQPSKSPPAVFVNAVKLAEESDEIVIRVKEMLGQPHERISIRFPQAIISAREVNGAEDSLGAAAVEKGELAFSLKPYQPRAFAIRIMQNHPHLVTGPRSIPVALPYNQDGISSDNDRGDGNFDGLDNTLAGELLPEQLTYQNLQFTFGPRGAGENNIVRCEGQTIQLPSEPFNRLYIIAASTGGPDKGTFTVDGKTFTVAVPDYAEPIAQWNNRLNGGLLVEERRLIAPAYINREAVAWYASHRHTADGQNEAYRFTYLFSYRFDLPQGAKILSLPNDPRIKVMGVTAVQSSYADIDPVHPLYDIENGTPAKIIAEHTAFLDPVAVTLKTPIPGATLRYTLDGTDPTATSTEYKDPIRIVSTSTVKARAFHEGYYDDHISAMTFTKLEPHPSSLVTNLKPGLRAGYFEGTWDQVPPLDTMQAVREFIADEIVLPPFARKEDFGLFFEGFINIPTDGLYEFGISSDDGSFLWISDSLVVDNDGLHGGGFVDGLIALKAGYHQIRVHMFQAKGDRDLQMQVSGPSIRTLPLPKNWLFYQENALEKSH